MEAARQRNTSSLEGSETLALQTLALQLAGPAHGLGRFASAPLGRLLIVPPQLHLAENPLPLHLLLERFQRLVDIVIPNENLHLAAFSSRLNAPKGRE